MVFLRRIAFLLVGISACLSVAMAQGSDSIIINEYFKVTAVFDKENLKEDTIVIESGSTFKKGDTILIYQVKGARWNNSWDQPAFSGTEFSGRFEFQVIQKRIQDTLILRRPLISSGKTKKYNPNAVMQVIKVPTYKYFKTDKTITAKKFDGKTGGVLAMFADTIELNGRFNVSGKGFRGADPSADNSKAYCWSSDSAKMTPGNFTVAGVDSAGLKGESSVEFSNTYLRGRAPVGNGGGGGNGHYSGGGGGSSFGRGGSGGIEASPCILSKQNMGGSGGIRLNGTDYFKRVTLDASMIFGRIDTIPYAVLGGGGGASNSSLTTPATAGGSGGGIVIIIANVFKTTTGQILANGESITDGSAAGGGGGGGGGGILFDVNTLVGKPTLSVRGGNGGNTLVRTDTAGPGGGGGGGYILYKGDTLTATFITSQGFQGKTPKGGTNSASAGGPGATLSNLIIPLKGFLFNIMPHDQEICEGETPKLFEASVPKGSKLFKYKWRKSRDLKTWDSVANVMRYQSGPLVDTTYFQRIVYSIIQVNNKDSVLDVDTSNILVINVLPAIKNNNIHTDTFEVCKLKKMPIVYGDALSGGNGIYTFNWQDSSKGSWKTADGKSNELNYQPANNDSIKLRRMVSSGVCKSYSNIVSIDVLPLISGNSFNDVYIEQGRKPRPLRSDTLFGGNNKYSFVWEKSSNKTSWVAAPGKFDSISLVLDKPDSTFYYKRTIWSGLNKTCESTSNIITVFLLDSLYGNTIEKDMIVCRLSAPTEDFKGSQVSGGDKKYKYLWEVSTNQVKWDTSAIVTTLNFNPGIIKEECYFRRIALSGPTDACKDTSKSIHIYIRPEILNFELINQDTVICNKQSADILKAKQPVGGDGPYSYQWYVSTNKKDWTLAEGNSNMSSYSTPVLTDTSYFYRKVNSGVCTQNSDTIAITVLPSISKNSLASVLEACYKSLPDSIALGNALGGDGKYKYLWIESTDNKNWIQAEGKASSAGYRPAIAVNDKYFKRLVLSGLNDCCIDTSNAISLHVNSLPEAIFSSKNDSICLGESYTLKLKVNNGTPLFSLNYVDGTSEYRVKNIASRDTIINVKPNTAGIYKYNISSLSDAKSCVAQILAGDVELHVFEVPKALVGPDTAACGLVAPLKAFPGVGKGKWTARVPAVFEPSDSIENITVKIDSGFYGHRIFTWTLNNGGCIDSAIQRVVFYQPPPDPLVGENIEGPFLFSTNLKAYLPILGQGKWTTPDKEIILNDPNDPESKVEHLKFGKNIFFWYVENGLCIAASDTFVVDVQDIKVPNGFSPNGDDKNPVFEIKGLEQAPNSELTILNRWGKEVYKSYNYTNNWNGTSNGAPLPSETYFYILNTIGRTYKGYVVIKR